MLKKLGMVVLLLPMLFSVKAQANDYCNTCCDSEWEIYGDWIYWKPRSQALDYATPNTPQLGDIQRIQPSYKSGFRVGLYYECDALLYDFFYTRFHQDYSDSATTVLPETLLSTRVSGGTSTAMNATWSFDYDTVDLLVGSKLNNHCSCFDPYFFGGLKLVFIDQSFTTNFITTGTTPTTILSTQKTKLDGYGVNFGLGMDYDFWGCLGFFSRISGDVFLAKLDRDVDQTSTTVAGVTTTTMSLDDDYWNVISALNVMFGLQYDYKFDGCWCGNLGIAVGYEFHHYYGISAWLNSYQITGGGLRRDLDNLSLDGLFVRVSLGF